MTANGSNGTGILPAVSDPITTAPKKRRGRKAKGEISHGAVVVQEKYVAASSEIEWKATLLRDVHGYERGCCAFPHAQTWFFARAAAMALFGCGPRDVEVVRT